MCICAHIGIPHINTYNTCTHKHLMLVNPFPKMGVTVKDNLLAQTLTNEKRHQIHFAHMFSDLKPLITP